MSISSPLRNQLQSAVHERAGDEGFRVALTANPQGVINGLWKELTGGALAEGVRVSVHEEAASELHVVLPAHPEDAELLESELEGVAGGWPDSDS